MDAPRALVIGGSMAGMLAAHALADFMPVTLVERDPLPERPDARRGLPQASHLHTILSRGLNYLERLFPRLRSEMIADGAILVDSGNELGWLGPFGWSQRFASGELESVWATRDFLDAHIRRRLRLHPGITWVDGTRIESLVLDPSAGRVRGARAADGSVFPATLVVDATGRGSKLPDWLRAAGLDAPSETEVDARTVYTSAFARFRSPFPNGWKVLFILGASPRILRGAAIGPVEDGRMLVSLATAGGEPAPHDTAGFADFGHRLRAPFIGDLFEGAEWLSPARTTRSTANRWRHYERANLPAGLVAVGDAFCAFNPIFGQGISVASMQAEALSKALRARRTEGAAWTASAMRALARQVAFPWAMATSQDLRIPGTVGKRPRGQALADAYFNRLFSLATHDGATNLRLSRVFNLIASPLTLYAPRTVWRVLREPLPALLVGPVGPPDRSPAGQPPASPRTPLMRPAMS